jgi:hypothetical protein
VLPPPILDRGGLPVGYGTFFRMTFDTPIQSISCDLAETDTPNTHSPSLELAALSGFPGGQLLGRKSEFYTLGQWHHSTFVVDPRTRALELQGWLYVVGENFPHPFYFDNLEVTYVPEPRSVLLFVIGSIGIAFFRAERPRPTK